MIGVAAAGAVVGGAAAEDGSAVAAGVAGTVTEIATTRTVAEVDPRTTRRFHFVPDPGTAVSARHSGRRQPCKKTQSSQGCSD